MHDSIKDALSNRIEKTITTLHGMHKEIKSFQRGNDDIELDLDGFTMNCLLTNHMLMFELKEGPKSRIRTFCACMIGGAYKSYSTFMLVSLIRQQPLKKDTTCLCCMQQLAYLGIVLMG